MANDITQGDGFISFNSIDADWTWNKGPGKAFQNSPLGIPVDFIKFCPVVNTDKCSIKLEDENGPEIFGIQPAGTLDQVQIVYYHGTLMKLFLDVSDGQFNASSSLIIKTAAPFGS